MLQALVGPRHRDGVRAFLLDSGGVGVVEKWYAIIAGLPDYRCTPVGSAPAGSESLKNATGRKCGTDDSGGVGDAIVALRAYLRHRASLVESAGAHVQRMQKALVQMNVQLPLVVSDITGVTGQRIVRDIVAGERDPQRLAAHRDRRCRASEAEIVAALTGNYRPEHVFILQQNLALFDRVQEQITACDAAVEAHLDTLVARATPPTSPLPAKRGRSARSDNPGSSFGPRCIRSPESISPRLMALGRTPPCASSPRSGRT